MTTLKAVSQDEIVVCNNGRSLRIPVANLVSVDEVIACCAHKALAAPGTVVEVPSKQPRGCRPRNYAYAGVQQ